MAELPPYNNARGFASSLQLVPPCLFKDVTMSVLPLRANLPRLQPFCDAYLNRATDLFVFEPFVPSAALSLVVGWPLGASLGKAHRGSAWHQAKGGRTATYGFTSQPRWLQPSSEPWCDRQESNLRRGLRRAA